MKLHVVDGTFELFRCWFGAPKRQNEEGLEVGAVRGLLRTLYSLLMQDDCSHVAVAYDRVIESFRNDLFDGYKTGDGIESDLWAQFPLAEQAARALGMTVWPMVRYEADDALASAAAAFVDEVDQVVLCTPDKDLAQCVVGDRVVLHNRLKDTTMNEQAIVERFGVPPTSIPDWLALVGDAADGIPGVPRWGAKSTATVLARYGTLDAIPDAATDWDVEVRGAASLAEQLRNHRAEAELYKVLATLANDAPIERDLGALKWQGPDLDRLTPLCELIGDTRFVPQVTSVHR